MYVRTHTAYSSSSVLLRPPDPRPQTKDLLLLLRPPDPRPQIQNLLLLLRPPDPRPQPPDPKPYVSFRKQRRSPLNWNARRQRGRASSHHGGEYVPPGRNQGKSRKFPQEPARGRRARGQPRPNRSRRTDPFPMRLPRGQRLPTYVRTYVRTYVPYLTYVLTYVRMYRDCYVRRRSDCVQLTYVRTYSSSSVLLRPPPSSRPQTRNLLLLFRPPDPRP